ncbi:MAG TPA: amidohydrolase family protein, partial [Cytophagales bacterium]|nr:amidohydrolase family protein [Cytophagales bacterium]
YSQSEINMLMKVAESFNFKVNTFTHVLEGYKISDKLRKHGAGASSFSDWWSFKAEVRDAIPHNAALLSNAGLVTAINSDDPEMGTRLNQEAAKSVKYGNLSEAEAWRLVTLNPARLLRVDDKIGSIKIGKLANVVIWSANPLSVYAKAERVYIEGTKYYDIDEDEKLANKNRNVRKQILEEMLNDKTPEDKKAVPVPEKQEHYHCDSFETIE